MAATGKQAANASGNATGNAAINAGRPSAAEHNLSAVGRRPLSTAPTNTWPPTDRQPTDRNFATAMLHPQVYLLLIALAAWFALAVWSFAGDGVTDYLLFVVSGFIFVVIALVTILSQVGSGGSRTGWRGRQSFRDWMRFRFETWTGRQTGAQAVVEIALPIAVAAAGMTAIGIVFHIVAAALPPGS